MEFTEKQMDEIKKYAWDISRTKTSAPVKGSAVIRGFWIKFFMLLYPILSLVTSIGKPEEGASAVGVLVFFFLGACAIDGAFLHMENRELKEYIRHYAEYYNEEITAWNGGMTFGWCCIAVSFFCIILHIALYGG